MLSSEAVLGANDPSPICRLVNSVLFCLMLQRHFTNIIGNGLLPACPANKASAVEKELVGKMPATTEVFQYQAVHSANGYTLARPSPRLGRLKNTPRRFCRGANGPSGAAFWRRGDVRILDYAWLILGSAPIKADPHTAVQRAIINAHVDAAAVASAY